MEQAAAERARQRARCSRTRRALLLTSAPAPPSSRRQRSAAQQAQRSATAGPGRPLHAGCSRSAAQQAPWQAPACRVQLQAGPRGRPLHAAPRTVESNCALVAPHLSATARPCMISGASGPTLQRQAGRGKGRRVGAGAGGTSGVVQPAPRQRRPPGPQSRCSSRCRAPKAAAAAPQPPERPLPPPPPPPPPLTCGSPRPGRSRCAPAAS
jgi:hypothetical protein